MSALAPVGAKMTKMIKRSIFAPDERVAKSMANRSARDVISEQGWGSVTVVLRKKIYAASDGGHTCAGIMDGDKFLQWYEVEFCESRQ